MRCCKYTNYTTYFWRRPHLPLGTCRCTCVIKMGPRWGYQSYRIEEQWFLSRTSIFHWCSTIIQGEINHAIDQFVHPQKQKIGQKATEPHIILTFTVPSFILCFALFLPCFMFLDTILLHFVVWLIVDSVLLELSVDFHVLKGYKWTWTWTTFLSLFSLFILSNLYRKQQVQPQLLWFLSTGLLEIVGSYKLK